MHRLALSATAILLLLRIVAYPQQTPAEIASGAGKSVCLIAAKDDDGNWLGLGSGFVCANGKVATNYHVIESALKVFVRFSDNEVYETQILSDYDVKNDLAILKIETLGVPALTLGDSDSVSPGDSVVVISSPRGLENSVSNGLVSAIRMIEKEQELIQISAPVSPGSSGGPVFNSKGEVIGIAVASLEGQNLNFAIPVSYLKPMLISEKHISLKILTPSDEKNVKSEAVSLEGSWLATFSDSPMSGKLYFNIVQNSKGEIAGTYSASTGGGGTISGKLADGSFVFELTQNIEGCPGIFKGIMDGVGDAFTGTYYGSDCLGEHKNGKFTMNRSREAFDTSARPSNVKPVITYGDLSELLDVKKVYVYTGAELEVRDNIIKKLKKYKDVTVVNDLLEADIILVYGASWFSMGSHTHVWSDAYGNVYSNTTPRAGVTGVGYAVKYIPPNTFRLVWQFEDTRKTILERRPSTNFARNFVKTLKKVKPRK